MELFVWLTLGYSVSSPCRGQVDATWPKVLTINHIISTLYLAWPKAKVNKDPFIRLDIPGA